MKKIDKQQKLVQKRAKLYLKSLDANKVKIVLKIDDYEQLGYTLKSIQNILQTTILVEIEHPELVDHTQWDIYNLLNLTKSLIPESEFEFLDRLNTK